MTVAETVDLTETEVGPTRTLARFASELTFDSLPADVVEHAKVCLIDNIACTLFGATLPWSQHLIGLAGDLNGSDQATIWGSSRRTSADLAALVNATAGHGFEMDDLHMTSLFHPGPVTIGAAVATSEAFGARDGQTLLTAIVAGYEVGVRVGMAGGQGTFFRGFHPQGVTGTFSAASAAGRVLGLDPEQMTNALGITGSQSAGLMAAQEGAMVKRMHSGRASQSGVYSALLAKRGFTGTVHVLEAEFGGYLDAMAEEEYVRPELLVGGLGEEFEILKVGFKPYPTCASIHTSLDGLGALRDEYGFSADDVEKITVRPTTMTAVHCAWEYEAQGVTAAQMNQLYCVAALMVDGEVTINQFTEEKIRDPRIMEYISKIEVIPSEELDAVGPEGRHASIVEVELKDGRTLSRRTDQRKGSIQNPMSRQEVIDKYHQLVNSVMPAGRSAEILAIIESMEDLEDVRDLTRLLQPA